MTVGKTDEIKQELARKVENTKAGTKLKKSMSIADMIKVMEPQIKKALPEVITPERFTSSRSGNRDTGRSKKSGYS